MTGATDDGQGPVPGPPHEPSPSSGHLDGPMSDPSPGSDGAKGAKGTKGTGGIDTSRVRSFIGLSIGLVGPRANLAISGVLITLYVQQRASGALRSPSPSPQTGCSAGSPIRWPAG